MAKHESMINVWRERVRECKTSGLTVAEWCEKNHINKKTYFYWQKQVWDHEINTMAPDQPAQFLAEIRISYYTRAVGPWKSETA